MLGGNGMGASGTPPKALNFRGGVFTAMSFKVAMSEEYSADGMLSGHSNAE